MLDWEKFKNLTGSDSENFEKLCRSIVRRRFGSFGPLIERKNHPGVEFYIRLSRNCSGLGSSGKKVGWQCKWFGMRADRKLTSSQRKQIKCSLNATKAHVGDLNRWILWTPFTLAKADQDWFYDLQSEYEYELHLWNAKDIDGFLEGPALELRHAYFGELALTDEALEKQHGFSVAPIKERWIKEVHQQVRVEKQLRQYLGEPSAWEEFKDVGASLSEAYETIKRDVNEPVYCGWSEDLERFLFFCSECLKFAEYFTNTLSAEEIEPINGMLGQVKSLDSRIRTVLRQIRNRNLPLAIEITNSLAYIKDIRNLLENASEFLSSPFIAVLADAGGGKTHMAAELTGVQPDRPAGILLHGRRFQKGSTLDDLAQEISFYGQKIPSFQTLVSALDAAAYRSNCRLPIIIDGLSEAEEPREWKPELETALELLKNYPNVLLICTLRTGERERHRVAPRRYKRAHNREIFAQMALPEDCVCLECDGFGNLTMKAVKSYFRHYKIEADLIRIPENFFSHPLNLRIFCEVTNRRAEETVKVTTFPASITTLFGKQIEYAAGRIAELTSFQRPYSEEDVLSAVFHLGKKLWESGKRQIPETDFLHSLDQSGRSWDENIVNLLAQEGIIFRDPDNVPGKYFITPVFDRLGGYIIADALLKESQSDSAFNWIRSETSLDRLFGEDESSHSLSQDILHALVALAPKYSDNRKQLWMVVPEEYREAVVELSTLIDPENFCDRTKEEYRKQILRKGLDYFTLTRLDYLRASNHPLNADFLSDLLKAFSVKERDLSWTEFLRRYQYHDYVLAEIGYLEQRWKSDDIPKTAGDRLLAVWVSWLLTSTSIDIRDRSTRALYWYGRSCPKHLFEMTISSLDINDPYVPERLLAAGYGVVMFFAYKEEHLEEMKWLVSRLYEQTFCKSAKNPTTHFLARDYASQTIQTTRKLLLGTLSDEQLADASHPYVSMPRRKWGSVDGITRGPRHEFPLGMDFENYTIGRLVPERAPYDFDHPDYQDVRAKILWRIERLGWNKEDYAKVEESIVAGSTYNRMNRPRIERYGKKYSWIAYYEMAGQRLDEEVLDIYGERFAADIDPGFPEPIYERELRTAEYLGDSDVETSDWIKNSNLPEISHLTEIDSLDGISGPWILLDGYVSEESRKMDRNFDFICRAFLVKRESLQKLVSYWEDGGRENIKSPELIQTGCLYSGELNRLSDSMLDSDAKFELVVGKKVEKQEQLIFIEEEGIPVLTNERELVDVEVPVNESIRACSLVAGFFWNAGDSSMPSIQARVPTSRFMETLGLKIDPVSLDVVDTQGNLAARNIFFRGQTDDNCRRLFYMREDLLTRFMTEEELHLVWFVRGERRIADIYTSDVKYKEFRFCKPIER